MFDKKYKKVLELLDEEINFAAQMHDQYLHINDNRKLSDEEMINDLTLRGGRWSQIDKYQAELDVLCGLRRKIKKELGR